MPNGIVSLISLILCWLVDGNVRCTNLVSFGTPPNSSIRPGSFLVASVGFSLCSIMSSANSDSFTTTFPICVPFMSVSSLVAVARTSNTMLNKSGETSGS